MPASSYLSTAMCPSTEPDEEAIPPSDEKLLSVRLIGLTLGILVTLVLGMVIVGVWFREPLMRISAGFVESFGGLGVALGYFLTDAFTLPLPNDIGPILAIAGGMSFVEVCVWGASGSILGGFVGYLVGRQLGTTRIVSRVLDRNDGRAQRMLERHGLTAVAVAAITPLPYSIFCWAAGAAKLPLARFMAVSIPLRIIRVADYLYLIRLGLLPA